jgi:hypothetical protein
MKHLTIRQKLTLWCGGVMAAILALWAGSVYWLNQRHLLALVDRTLGKELDMFIGRVLSAPNPARLGDHLGAEFGHRDRFEFQVITARGTPLFRSHRFHLGVFAGPRRASEHAISFVDLLCDYGRSTERFRLASRVVKGRDGSLIVQALTSEVVKNSSSEH